MVHSPVVGDGWSKLVLMGIYEINNYIRMHKLKSKDLLAFIGRNYLYFDSLEKRFSLLLICARVNWLYLLILRISHFKFVFSV